MDSLSFIVLLFMVFIGIPIGLGLLFYFVPKKLGYPKTAKYLTFAYVLFVLTIVFYIAFEDQLFTKSNARELVEEQDFKLVDEFELLRNESMSAIGDYYHTFTLKISERDKQNAIYEIKSSDNFKAANFSIDHVFHFNGERYFGSKVIQNYETENSFVREYYKPSGREGYAPTFRRIAFSKTKNELIFEDIEE